MEGVGVTAESIETVAAVGASAAGGVADGDKGVEYEEEAESSSEGGGYAGRVV